jgi:hypothetical protein
VVEAGQITKKVIMFIEAPASSYSNGFAESGCMAVIGSLKGLARVDGEMIGRSILPGSCPTFLIKK